MGYNLRRYFRSKAYVHCRQLSPMFNSEPCDGCSRSISDALSRIVRLIVDQRDVDSQRVCPDCFASWIRRYESEMQLSHQVVSTDDIIVD